MVAEPGTDDLHLQLMKDTVKIVLVGAGSREFSAVDHPRPRARAGAARVARRSRCSIVDIDRAGLELMHGYARRCGRGRRRAHLLHRDDRARARPRRRGLRADLRGREAHGAVGAGLPGAPRARGAARLRRERGPGSRVPRAAQSEDHHADLPGHRAALPGSLGAQLHEPRGAHPDRDPHADRPQGRRPVPRVPLLPAARGPGARPSPRGPRRAHGGDEPLLHVLPRSPSAAAARTW